MFSGVRSFLYSSSQPIYLANILSLLFASLVLGLLVILFFLFGWASTYPFILGVAGIFFSVILLNKSGHDLIGRLIFCLLPIYGSLIISIMGKLESDKQSYIIYFDSRYLLLGTSVLPAIVFDFKEKLSFLVCQISTFLCLMLFDPIHNMIGIGYYQRGFTAKSYYYVNYIIFIAYTALVSGVLILKSQFNKASKTAALALKDNIKINEQLQDQNRKLQGITHEMEAQNEELMQQQEELTTNQEKLEAANETISVQARELENYNLHLQNLVNEKSGDLLKTNKELVETINELRQFSFSVSHNLRGPVARLLGLTNLIQINSNPDEQKLSIQFIQQSALELDEIIKDLSSIIEIRSELYRVREKISIKEEIDRSLALIGNEVVAQGKFQVDLEEKFIYGIRPMVHSILYNLLSNSIKYRHPERPLLVTVRSYTSGTKNIIIEISDNGLGIDTELHKQNVFKLYKRFHLHVPGKGLGLYLVKSQIELMNGRVDIKSAVNTGTTFILTFPLPGDLSKQIFFENNSAQLYYDAEINNTVILWKKKVTSAEYREVFENVLQTIKKYNTPGWIADLRNQGIIDKDDQQWFISNVLKAAADNGLKRIATLGFHDPMRRDYYERMANRTMEFGIELQVFHDMDSAVAWMQQAY